MTRHPSIARLLALTLLTTATAFAADPPKKERTLGKGTAAGPLLTREQLRACMAHHDDVAQQNDAMLKEQEALNAMKADIARTGDELKAKLETVDRTNAEAVAAYNAQGAAHDKAIDDFQARANAFNAKVDAQKADREAYSKACDNRRYLEDDEIAIKKGK